MSFLYVNWMLGTAADRKNVSCNFLLPPTNYHIAATWKNLILYCTTYSLKCKVYQLPWVPWDRFWNFEPIIILMLLCFWLKKSRRQGNFQSLCGWESSYSWNLTCLRFMNFVQITHNFLKAEVASWKCNVYIERLGCNLWCH